MSEHNTITNIMLFCLINNIILKKTYQTFIYELLYIQQNLSLEFLNLQLGAMQFPP